MRSFLLPSKLLRGIIIAGLVASTVQVQAANWNGGVITSGQSNVDTNFFISNTNILTGPGAITVEAITQDVTATVGANAVLQSGSALVAGRLFIHADAGRTVFFDLSQNDLSFIGSVDGLTRLLVSFSGEGQLTFILGNGRKVSFATDELTGTAGTNFYALMNATAVPTVNFTRFNDNSTSDVEIVVGHDSAMTYLASVADVSNPAAAARIQFNPANQRNGSMILRILDGGAVDISGHLVVLDNNDEFANADVDLAVLAGGVAGFDVISAGSLIGATYIAGLEIINNNYQLPHLRSEPFHDCSFNGVLHGFVLGANGIMVINDASYVDYIGTTLNCCPAVCNPCHIDPSLLEPCILPRSATRACGSCAVGSSSLVDFNCDDLDDLCLSCSLVPCDVCTGPAGECDCTPFTRANDCLIKARNASAFFVDGHGRSDVDADEDVLANIVMLGCSGLYFRSGVDACGQSTEANDFIINGCGSFEALSTPGAGNVVFDVEGPLNVQGQSANANAIRLLSSEVTKAGCPVIIADETECPTLLVFPAITHNVDDVDGEFLRYNRGAFLINNRVDLRNVSLVHTDDNHHVLERDDLDRGDPRLFSEPTYIGGEFVQACQPDEPRPVIALYNSIIRFHESAGFTGVDIQVPNLQEGNESALRFYSNGFCVDRGTGRILILGTNNGDRSCSSCEVIDHNSHLDVFQTTDQLATSTHVLVLDTAPNDQCFSLRVDAPANPDESSIQVIYLGNESNISIGTAPGTAVNPQPVFTAATTPTVIIDGTFFSFETSGGSAHLPELTGTLGEGAIFVDTNGVLENANRNRANISTMVVRSGNGVIDLPQTEVFFNSRVGVTDWRPNLMVNNVLVGADESFSDFTIDWMQVVTDCDSFVPYDPRMTPLVCDVPPVTEANVTNLPTILGTVQQLQVKRSRLGDQITLQIGDATDNVPGGFVRELIFLKGFNAAEAAMGTIVLDGFGRVGLGSAATNYDSNEANIKLGINGVTVIAKGDGVVELNQDVYIDNVCHILPGPDFGAEGAQTLTFFSNDSRELRIKSTGVLDLSLFRGPNQVVEFGGNIRLVFEPGARMILSNVANTEDQDNRTYVRFTDLMSINFEQVYDTTILDASAPNAVEERLVKWSGNAYLQMTQGSSLLLPDNTFLGIETAPECSPLTDIILELRDESTFNIGDQEELGGTFQVGNRVPQEGAVINFNFLLNGVNTLAQIRREGLMLYGVGGVSVLGNIPNNYTYQCLSNVGDIIIQLGSGIFDHTQIFSGDDPQASLLALGNARSYSFDFDVNFSIIRGGGNFALVEGCPSGAFPIIVEDFNGDVSEDLIVGILSSKAMLRDGAVTQTFLGIPPQLNGIQAADGFSPLAMYSYLHVQTYNFYVSPKATIALNDLTIPVLGFVVGDTAIVRTLQELIVNASGDDVDYVRSVRRGAVQLSANNLTGNVIKAAEIKGGA